MAHPLAGPEKGPLDRHRQLAPTASVKVSPLCLGGMNFGESWEYRMGKCDKNTTFEILDYFKSQGGNFIDTANTYQNEESEIWIGEWMAARDCRDEMVLATKYSSGYKGHEKHRIQTNYGGNNSKTMKVSLDQSLKKLQTTYIDLFYVHWWDYSTSIPELMHSLNDLVVAGKVIYLGISDTPAWVVTKANQYARDHGLRPFVVYQGLWNAGVRDFERDIIPMARDEGMALAPYGTLGQGRFQTAESFKQREAGDHPGRKAKPVTEHDKHVSSVLEKIATAKNVALVNVALAYVLHKTPYVFPIVGCRKVDHLKGSIGALTVNLSDEEMEEIDCAYDFDPGFPHTFLSGTLFTGKRPWGAKAPEDVWLTQMQGRFDWVAGQVPIRPRVQGKEEEGKH